MLTDHERSKRPRVQKRDIPPLRSMLKRGERYVKLYSTIVRERAATVARETARSCSSKWSQESFVLKDMR